MHYSKYPKTWHLPSSGTVNDSDRILLNTDHFKRKEVVVLEKMDGENTTLYNYGLHARSLNWKPHPSRNWITAMHSMISSQIYPNMRICGENVYAKHSIFYENLPTYFFVFAIFENELCLSWDDTVEWCGAIHYSLKDPDGIVREHKLMHVPVLYRGIWDEEKIRNCYSGRSVYGDESEGYVVRLASSFEVGDFALSVAKWVRANHVQPNEIHWMKKAVIPNRLNIVDDEALG